MVAANYRVVLSVSIATLYKNGFVEINTIARVIVGLFKSLLYLRLVKTKKTKRLQNTLLCRVAIVALLFFYILGSFPSDSIHAIVHAKEVTELHSSAHESDPCHQLLFHANANKGCEHKTHWINGAKCAFTQIGHQPSHVAESAQEVKLSTEFVYLIPFVQTNFISAFAGFYSTRAPPTSII